MHKKKWSKPLLALQGQDVDQDRGLIGEMKYFVSCRNLFEQSREKHSKIFKQYSNTKGHEPIRVLFFFSLQIIASFIYLFFCLWDNNNYNARPDGGIVIIKEKGKVAKVFFKNKNKKPHLNANQQMLILLGLQS